MSDSRQLCSFLLGDLLFGVEVKSVQEVIRFQPMTRVPLASSLVRGLINLRGQIVTALDLRARLGLPSLEEPMNVVVRTGEGVVSLAVDEIGDVLEVNGDDFELAPETLPAALREIVLGVYKLERRLLLLLDVERVVALEESGTPLPGAPGAAWAGSNGAHGAAKAASAERA